MINKKFIQKLKQEYDKREGERRQIISLSNIILHDSKRIIFSLHRGELVKAEAKFAEIESILKKLEKKFTLIRINEEGAYRAAAEEYAEAKMFYFVLSAKRLDKIKEVNLKYESYLGGICDLVGEMVRLAVNRAAQGEFDEVVKINKTANDIIAELVEFDMTGYLRTKYDQAKGHLRKIEQINYEVTMKRQ